jgi:hypothetical protein
MFLAPEVRPADPLNFVLIADVLVLVAGIATTNKGQAIPAIAACPQRLPPPTTAETVLAPLVALMPLMLAPLVSPVVAGPAETE